jgi:DNA repair exonuclease SbcCD ATPase subunit
VRLTRIAATNFEGYAELDLDLSQVTSVAVTGKNGHGKSGLLDVVTYALGGRGRFRSTREGGSPDQQIRHGTESMWTCVEFDAPSGEHVRVERSKAAGKTASVHLWVDAAELSTQWTNAETDAAIARLIGLPLDTLLAGPIMAQEQASALMRAQSGDRLRMFVKLFEAEWCAALHDEAKVLRDSHEAERVMATARVGELQTIIDGEPQLAVQLEQARSEQAALMERQSLGNDQLTDLKIKMAEVRVRAERRVQIDGQVTTVRNGLQRNANEWTRIRAIVDRAEAVLAEPEPMLPDIEAPDDAAIALVARDLEEARAQAIVGARLRAEADALLREVTRAHQQRDILGGVPCGGQGEFAACRFLTGVPSAEAVSEMERSATVAMNSASAAADIGGKVGDARPARPRPRGDAPPI